MRAKGVGKSLQELSGLFGYSRQHFYQQRRRLSARTLREAAILDFVDRHRKEQSQLGTVKLQYLWNKQPFSILTHYYNATLYCLLHSYVYLKCCPDCYYNVITMPVLTPPTSPLPICLHC